MSASRWIGFASVAACSAMLAPGATRAEVADSAPSSSLAPDIDALPVPAASDAVDLESLAKGYEALVARDGSAAPIGPRLLVFVSFAMPEAALNRLIDQASRAGATLYLRGLVGGSLKETVARVQPLLGHRRVPFEIDPRAFDRFAVAATPSFVLVRAGAREPDCAAPRCTSAETFVKVTGDVSLDYALEFIQRSAPEMTSVAAGLLERLKR